MASFVASVDSGADVRNSRAVNTVVNDELNNSTANAITGAGKLLNQGVEYLATSITEDAGTATVSALENFGEDLLSNPDVYNEIKKDLKGKYKADVLSKMSNKTLADLKTVQIKKELELKYGTTSLGRNAINQAMQDTLGYVSPVFLAQKEQRAGQNAAAVAQIKARDDLKKAFIAQNYPIPLIKGTSNVDFPAMESTARALQNTGVNIYNLTAAGKAQGGPIGAENRNPVEIAKLSNDIAGVYQNTLGGLAEAYQDAQSPKDKAIAATNLYRTMIDLKRGISAGTHPITKASGGLVSTLNAREQRDLFKGGDAVIATLLGDSSIESMASLTPENVSKDFLAATDIQVKTITALSQAKMLQTPIGMALLATKDLPDSAVKLLTEQFTKVQKNLLNKGMPEEDVSKIMTGTFFNITKGDGEGDGNVSAAIFKSMFSTFDPKKAPQWERAITNIIKDGVVKQSEGNRKAAMDLMDTAPSLDFFKAIMKNNRSKADEIFTWYSNTKTDQQEDFIKGIVDDANGVNVSFKGQYLVYEGPPNKTIEQDVIDFNKSTSNFNRFKGTVPDSALPKLDGLKEFFNKRVSERKAVVKKGEERSSGKIQPDAKVQATREAMKLRKIDARTNVLPPN